MLDWLESWAPMVIDWPKSWTTRRSCWIPSHLLPPAAAAPPPQPQLTSWLFNWKHTHHRAGCLEGGGVGVGALKMNKKFPTLATV